MIARSGAMSQWRGSLEVQNAIDFGVNFCALFIARMAQSTGVAVPDELNLRRLEASFVPYTEFFDLGRGFPEVSSDAGKAVNEGFEYFSHVYQCIQVAKGGVVAYFFSLAFHAMFLATPGFSDAEGPVPGLLRGKVSEAARKLGVNEGLLKDFLSAPSTENVFPMLEEVQKQFTAPGLGKAFIVHGHDEQARETVARFVEKLGVEAVILHEQANRGRTIIEKFEEHAEVGIAIVLLTGDDLGKSAADSEPTRPRARQNVIFELGFFVGSLGRDKVCVLYEEGVELPSDYRGVLYIRLDDEGAWRQALAKELREAGLNVDLNRRT